MMTVDASHFQESCEGNDVKLIVANAWHVMVFGQSSLEN